MSEKQSAIEKFGATTMKIGKFKDKTFNEICNQKDGKRYLFWFVDNVINEQNEKFYLKLMSYVKELKQTEQNMDTSIKK